jgi:hypothetical protein
MEDISIGTVLYCHRDGNLLDIDDEVIGTFCSRGSVYTVIEMNTLFRDSFGIIDDTGVMHHFKKDKAFLTWFTLSVEPKKELRRFKMV